jgi:hypothetical protein
VSADCLEKASWIVTAAVPSVVSIGPIHRSPKRESPIACSGLGVLALAIDIEAQPCIEGEGRGVAAAHP